MAGESVYATSTGAHRVITLADQTTVELNTASQLRSTLDGSKREVFLDRGEAYFDVAHDGSRPFVVHAGGQQIVVLGTSLRCVWMVRSSPLPLSKDVFA